MGKEIASHTQIPSTDFYAQAEMVWKWIMVMGVWGDEDQSTAWVDLFRGASKTFSQQCRIF